MTQTIPGALERLLSDATQDATGSVIDRVAEETPEPGHCIASQQSTAAPQPTAHKRGPLRWFPWQAKNQQGSSTHRQIPRMPLHRVGRRRQQGW
jgi:hypothetical protein